MTESKEHIRDDHAELLRRRALTEDAARPDAIARRHAANGRTARENIEDLIDAGSFVEYGRFAIAAQRFRRDVDDLIARTPGDRRRRGKRQGAQRRRCCSRSTRSSSRESECADWQSARRQG